MNSALAWPVMGQWGTRHSTSNCLLFGGSLQSRTNSDIRLHEASYPEKQYTGPWLCHCLLREVRNTFLCHP